MTPFLYTFHSKKKKKFNNKKKPKFLITNDPLLPANLPEDLTTLLGPPPAPVQTVWQEYLSDYEERNETSAPATLPIPIDFNLRYTKVVYLITSARHLSRQWDTAPVH